MATTHLSQALLALIDRRAHTATSLAKACGVHQVTVSRACAGERLSVESLKARCTRQTVASDGLELLLAHLRDEVERAGRSQTELDIAANGHAATDDILLLEEQARDDKELSAILHDLADMVRAFRRKLAEQNNTLRYPQVQDEPPADQVAAENQTPYNT